MIDQQENAAAPKTLQDLADLGARLLRDLDTKLECLYSALEKLEPELAARAVKKAGGRELAMFLLFAPASEWGGRSVLQLFLAGEGEKLVDLLQDDR